ncbi:hypothetical protein Nos7524_1664 [Nostoc sp. PCC 7524]|uniref:hypothetical protein n=1 Tax=Nostoc sp. (strain ATCC 29411 / PCC 7524) TaxID=28072 RepID=UPI00029F0EF6|nr:hypothetical protein [Nostoc sp. PCC 7524]AFY47536.1 hypothetical protein Nos7524_1664 [Nostoc sp. PCC 7524]
MKNKLKKLKDIDFLTKLTLSEQGKINGGDLTTVSRGTGGGSSTPSGTATPPPPPPPEDDDGWRDGSPTRTSGYLY